MNVHDMIKHNRNKAGVALPCFCTSNPFAIDAALSYAAEFGETVVIEATCNQVNQFGGYTGMRPADFAKRVKHEAAQKGIAEDKLILGGDHLGPEPWKHLDASEALELSKVMVQEFVEAGFTKIHLDASMACGGEPVLSATTVAERTAVLCAVAEAYAPDPQLLFYIIGTEVPVPGGETSAMDHVVPTTADSAEETIEAHRVVFHAAGLADALERVVSVVVQPGADFSHDSVLPYTRKNAEALSTTILGVDGLSFEAHSTDYQPDQALADLAQDHFAFLKVGPELTYALREAVFALASIEKVLNVAQPSRIIEVLQSAMDTEPKHWKSHYSGNEKELLLLKHYSFSDRIRYYWDKPEVSKAVAKLLDNLSQHPIPISLVSQYFGLPVGSQMPSAPEALIQYRIQQTVERYYRACRQKNCVSA